jgi:hypothetical protein
MIHSMKQSMLVGAMGLIAWASTPTDSVAASSASSLLRQQLVAELNECTGRYGYDPDQTAGLPENALAPTQLIDEDVAMTAKIQQGTLTRSERRARIEELLTEIRAAEDFQISASDNQGKGGQNPSWSSQERNQLGIAVAGVQGFY